MSGVAWQVTVGTRGAEGMHTYVIEKAALIRGVIQDIDISWGSGSGLCRLIVVHRMILSSSRTECMSHIGAMCYPMPAPQCARMLGTSAPLSWA
eukprot:6331865-Amphidinium_carterae.2